MVTCCTLCFCYFSGTPVLFVTPWTVVKILYENTEWVFHYTLHNEWNELKCSPLFDFFKLLLFLRCWSIVNRWFWWIIRGPITLSVLVSEVYEPTTVQLFNLMITLVTDASCCSCESRSTGASPQVNLSLSFHTTFNGSCLVRACDIEAVVQCSSHRHDWLLISWWQKHSQTHFHSNFVLSATKSAVFSDAFPLNLPWMCVAGHFLHIHQNPDAAAVQAESRPGEIYWLQIQVFSPALTR